MFFTPPHTKDNCEKSLAEMVLQIIHANLLKHAERPISFTDQIINIFINFISLFSFSTKLSWNLIIWVFSLISYLNINSLLSGQVFIRRRKQSRSHIAWIGHFSADIMLWFIHFSNNVNLIYVIYNVFICVNDFMSFLLTD